MEAIYARRGVFEISSEQIGESRAGCHLSTLTQTLKRSPLKMTWASRAHVFMPLPLLLLFLSTVHLVAAIKFNLPAFQYPPTKCIWNTVHTDTLVIVTANVGPGDNQRVDVSILDSSENKNVYLSKRGIKGESRLAITTHADGEVGVCFKNYIEGGRSASYKMSYIV